MVTALGEFHFDAAKRAIVIVVRRIIHKRIELARVVLYAVESAQPAISATKLRGLVDHYDFAEDDSAARYFALHAERDAEHAQSARAALEEAAPADTASLATAAERALEANWRLLDGVERAG